MPNFTSLFRNRRQNRTNSNNPAGAGSRQTQTGSVVTTQAQLIQRSSAAPAGNRNPQSLPPSYYSRSARPSADTRRSQPSLGLRPSQPPSYHGSSDQPPSYNGDPTRRPGSSGNASARRSGRSSGQSSLEERRPRRIRTAPEEGVWLAGRGQGRACTESQWLAGSNPRPGGSNPRPNSVLAAPRPAAQRRRPDEGQGFGSRFNRT